MSEIFSVYVVKDFLCTDLYPDYFCSNVIMLSLCLQSSAGHLRYESICLLYVGLNFHS